MLDLQSKLLEVYGFLAYVSCIDQSGSGCAHPNQVIVYAPCFGPRKYLDGKRWLGVEERKHLLYL